MRRSLQLCSANAAVEDGAHAFQQEHHAHGYAHGGDADPRIHHADEARHGQHNAQRQHPAPGAYAQSLQISGNGRTGTRPRTAATP